MYWRIFLPKSSRSSIPMSLSCYYTVFVIGISATTAKWELLKGDQRRRFIQGVVSFMPLSCDGVLYIHWCIVLVSLLMEACCFGAVQNNERSVRGDEKLRYVHSIIASLLIAVPFNRLVDDLARLESSSDDIHVKNFVFRERFWPRSCIFHWHRFW